ncbi:MAG: hypothetical protein ACREL6_05400, partial [Gemmatimonadales bacterium]
MFRPWEFAESLARDLSASGVRALLLRGPGPAGSPASRPPDEPFGLELLVPSEHAARARAVLDDRDWNYQLGGQGLWRVLPASTYSWAEAPYLWRQAPMVELSWSVVAALPLGGFRELERSLWQGASRHTLGWMEPDPESLAVYLSLQIARGGPRTEERLRHLAHCLSMASGERADRIAARCKVQSALAAAAASLRRPGGGGTRRTRARPPYDG